MSFEQILNMFSDLAFLITDGRLFLVETPLLKKKCLLISVLTRFGRILYSDEFLVGLGIFGPTKLNQML